MNHDLIGLMLSYWRPTIHSGFLLLASFPGPETCQLVTCMVRPCTGVRRSFGTSGLPLHHNVQDYAWRTVLHLLVHWMLVYMWCDDSLARSGHRGLPLLCEAARGRVACCRGVSSLL